LLRAARIACLAALALASAACTRFEQPIIAKDGPTLDRALVGRWVLENDHGRYEIEIRPDGDAGIVKPLAVEPKPDDEDQEPADMRLITARLGNLDFGSARSISKPDEGWSLFRYQVANDRLIVMFGDDAFWNDAVINKNLAGTIDKGKYKTTATITATGTEMGEFLMTYAPVVFPEETDPEFVFERVPDGS
jgi:hypothetical protein